MEEVTLLSKLNEIAAYFEGRFSKNNETHTVQQKLGHFKRWVNSGFSKEVADEAKQFSATGISFWGYSVTAYGEKYKKLIDEAAELATDSEVNALVNAPKQCLYSQLMGTVCSDLYLYYTLNDLAIYTEKRGSEKGHEEDYEKRVDHLIALLTLINEGKVKEANEKVAEGIEEFSITLTKGQSSLTSTQRYAHLLTRIKELDLITDSSIPVLRNQPWGAAVKLDAFIDLHFIPIQLDPNVRFHFLYYDTHPPKTEEFYQQVVREKHVPVQYAMFAALYEGRQYGGSGNGL